MDPDTDIGGPLHKFPATNHSAIINARSDDQLVRRRAFDTILASYWKPAYKYVRFKWQAGNEDAEVGVVRPRVHLRDEQDPHYARWAS